MANKLKTIKKTEKLLRIRMIANKNGTVVFEMEHDYLFSLLLYCISGQLNLIAEFIFDMVHLTGV